MLTNEQIAVSTDEMLTNGLMVIGQRYYVQTATYAYRGNLAAVTPTHYVLTEAEIVFETGEFDAYLQKGGAKAGSVVTNIPSKIWLIERLATVALAPVPGL